jgi:cell division protein FtsB
MTRMLARLTDRLHRLEARHWLALLAYGLAIYFGYHAVVGGRGLLAWRQLNQDIAATQQDLTAVRAERQALEEKVRRLRPESLDPDLIDELARRHLSLAGPLDVIILLDEKSGSK